MSLRFFTAAAIGCALLSVPLLGQQQETKSQWIEEEVLVVYSNETGAGLEFKREEATRANQVAENLKASGHTGVKVVPEKRYTWAGPPGQDKLPEAPPPLAGPKFKITMPEKKWVDVAPYNPPKEGAPKPAVKMKYTVIM